MQRRSVAESVRRDPRFTGGLVALGTWLPAQGREADARRAFEDALERNPADAASHREPDARAGG